MSNQQKNKKKNMAIKKALSLIDEFENTRKNKMPLIDGNEYVVALDMSLKPIIPVGLMAANPSNHKKLTFDTDEKGSSCNFTYMITIDGKYALYIRENYLNFNIVED